MRVGGTFAELVDRLALGQDLVGLPGTAPGTRCPSVTNRPGA